MYATIMLIGPFPPSQVISNFKKVGATTNMKSMKARNAAYVFWVVLSKLAFRCGEATNRMIYEVINHYLFVTMGKMVLIKSTLRNL